MAQGQTLLILQPRAALTVLTAAGKPALIRTINSHPALAFPADNDAYGAWQVVMPQHYGGNGIQVYISAVGDSTGTGDAIVAYTAFERIGAGVLDIDGDSIGSYKSDWAHGQAIDDIDIFQMRHLNGTEMDNVAAGEPFRFFIKRLPGTVAPPEDTFTGPLNVLGVEIRERQ